MAISFQFSRDGENLLVLSGSTPTNSQRNLLQILNIAKRSSIAIKFENSILDGNEELSAGRLFFADGAKLVVVEGKSTSDAPSFGDKSYALHIFDWKTLSLLKPANELKSKDIPHDV